MIGPPSRVDAVKNFVVPPLQAHNEVKKASVSVGTQANYITAFEKLRQIEEKAVNHKLPSPQEAIKKC